MKHITYILLVMIAIACSNSPQSVKGTKWQGAEKNDDTELILNNNDGIVVIHYSESETDTFKVTFKQDGNSVVISRYDSIVSVDQQGVLEGDTLKFKEGSFVKKK